MVGECMKNLNIKVIGASIVLAAAFVTAIALRPATKQRIAQHRREVLMRKILAEDICRISKPIDGIRITFSPKSQVSGMRLEQVGNSKVLNVPQKDPYHDEHTFAVPFEYEGTGVSITTYDGRTSDKIGVSIWLHDADTGSASWVYSTPSGTRGVGVINFEGKPRPCPQ